MGSEPETTQELEQKLNEVVATAHGNGVDVEGFYELVSKHGNPRWEAEIVKLQTKQ